MKRRTLLSASTLVLGAAVVADPRTDVADAAAKRVGDALAPPEESKAEAATRARINAERGERDLPALSRASRLTDAASAHSADMATRGFYGHTNPDGEGPTERAPCRAGEIIYRGDLGRTATPDGREWDTSTAAGIAAYLVHGWSGSQGHAEIMLGQRWAQFGVGVHIGDREFFATALFC